MAWALALLIVLATLDARAEPKANTSAQVRRALLRDYLEPHAEAEWSERYLPAIFGLTALGLSVGVGVADYNEDPSGRSRWVLVGAYGAASAVSLGSYAFPAEYRLAAVDATVGLLLIGTGAGFYVSSNATATNRFSIGAIMGAGAVYESLVILNASLERPISAAVLARDLGRIEQNGDRLTEADIMAIEQDFSRTQRPIPRWAFSLTLGVGGVVASSPVFAKNTSQDDKTLALVFGSILLTPALISIASLVANEGSSYDAYKRALRNVRLTPLGPAGSAGLTLAGQF